VVTALVCAVTPVFNVLTSEATLRSAVQGVVDGLLVTALVGGYVQFVRDGLLRPWFRELSFGTDLAISSPIVVALFLVGRGAGLVATSLDPGRFLRSFAGLHGGTVTAGELGDLRRQIVFVGDILNTAARLEEYAKRSGLDLVVSGSLLDRLELPPGVTARLCGELTLRGKEAPVAAYSLTGPPAPA
jgi:class 3 adenylate cyclase